MAAAFDRNPLISVNTLNLDVAGGGFFSRLQPQLPAEMQHYGQQLVPEMQEFMQLSGTAAGGATPHHQLFTQDDVRAAGAPAQFFPAPLHHFQQQQENSHVAAELLELYHRQAAAAVSNTNNTIHHANSRAAAPAELHHSHAEQLHRTAQSLFNVHNLQQHQHQQQKPELQNLTAHHMNNMDSDSAGQFTAMQLGTGVDLAAVGREHQELSMSAPDVGESFGDDGDRNGGRWPRVETLTLLRIRSDMDALFRDSGSKAPLWEEVSRRLYEAGYQRTAKKCKEKFENVHKYYKKTKDVNSDGKTYRFRSELEAIYAAAAAADSGHMDGDPDSTVMINSLHNPDSGLNGAAGSVMFGAAPTSSDTAAMAMDGSSLPLHHGVNEHAAGDAAHVTANTSSSTSGGTLDHSAHDVMGAVQSAILQDGGAEEHAEAQDGHVALAGRKRKRSSWHTMRVLFEDLAQQLIERQDAMHRQFLEAIERREEERQRREEEYRRQEMARLRRDQELRAQEQALAATRDSVLVAFLQKVTGETLHLPEMPMQNNDGVGLMQVSTPSGEQDMDRLQMTDPLMKDGGGGGAGMMFDGGSRRWPKVEVLALIRIRTNLEPRFQEAGPKAQLWEEVSASMACLGFSRSAKRCKEKWENINKYFRKTKDNSGRRRPDSANSKTCPYFHQLEELYDRGILASPNSSATPKYGNQKLGGCVDGAGSAPHGSAHHQYNSDDQAMPTDSTSKDDSGNNNNSGMDHSSFTTQLCMMNNHGGSVDGKGAYNAESSAISVATPALHLGLMQEQQLDEQIHGAARNLINTHGGGGAAQPLVEGFVREMMELQQQQHQKLVDEYERLERSRDVQQMERMQQQQFTDMAQAERSYRDSATLMALVQKLAAGGGASAGSE